MSLFRLAMVGLLCSMILLLSGCTPPPENLQVNTASHDLYLTQSHVVSDSPSLSLTVANQLSGDVTIFTGRAKEVVADVASTVVDVSLERALDKESRCIALDNTGGEVSVAPDPSTPPEDCAALRDHLHVRVPPGANLRRISTPAGNIRVFGSVADVTAVITTNGNIEVFGANGDVNLTTANGSITTELAPEAESVLAQTQNGDISLFVEDTWVTAATGNGNIRLIGGLSAQRHNSLTITGTGNLDVAVPAYAPQTQSSQTYRISAATRGSPIITDYPPTVLTICGFVRNNGPIDYRIQDAPQLRFGRIEVSPGITSSAFFSGTLGDNYYLFDTDQTKITFSPPLPPNVHVYTPAQLTAYQRGEAHLDAGCEEAVQSSIPASIVLDLKTGRGRIYFRHNYLNP